MADVKDANATPDTVSVSLHDTPDGDDLASAQLDSAGAEEGKSRSGDADGGEAEADSPAALALAASAFIAEIGAELKASAERALSSEPRCARVGAWRVAEVTQTVLCTHEWLRPKEAEDVRDVQVEVQGVLQTAQEKFVNVYGPRSALGKARRYVPLFNGTDKDTFDSLEHSLAAQLCGTQHMLQLAASELLAHIVAAGADDADRRADREVLLRPMERRLATHGPLRWVSASGCDKNRRPGAPRCEQPQQATSSSARRPALLRR